MPMSAATPADLDVAAKLFRGLSDPTRLDILVALVPGELRVTDLVDRIGCSQANVSGHLACLKGCGLVAARPEGRQVFYRIERPEIMDLLHAAEVLLAGDGVAIDLCPNYGRER